MSIYAENRIEWSEKVQYILNKLEEIGWKDKVLNVLTDMDICFDEEVEYQRHLFLDVLNGKIKIEYYNFFELENSIAEIKNGYASLVGLGYVRKDKKQINMYKDLLVSWCIIQDCVWFMHSCYDYGYLDDRIDIFKKK